MLSQGFAPEGQAQEMIGNIRELFWSFGGSVVVRQLALVVNAMFKVIDKRLVYFFEGRSAGISACLFLQIDY